MVRRVKSAHQVLLFNAREEGERPMALRPFSPGSHIVCSCFAAARVSLYPTQGRSPPVTVTNYGSLLTAGARATVLRVCSAALPWSHQAGTRIPPIYRFRGNGPSKPSRFAMSPDRGIRHTDL